MSFDNAIKALSVDALKFVKDGHVVGLGSGRAASIFVKTLSRFVKTQSSKIKCVPTSTQIKLVAEKGNLPLIEADQVEYIDVVFDGADQIDKNKYLIKGGGGALLRENILMSLAKKIVILADETKFVNNFNRSVPIEVLPIARSVVKSSILSETGSTPRLRELERGYPFVTENGNFILDCNFGEIKNPKALQQKIIKMPGVLEVGIFTRKPDVIYKAKKNGKFDILT
jgi:ribose 5-phosphate isomerase A